MRFCPIRLFVLEKLFVFKIWKTRYKENTDNELLFSRSPELRSYSCLNLRTKEISVLLEILELIIRKRRAIKDRLTSKISKYDK